MKMNMLLRLLVLSAFILLVSAGKSKADGWPKSKRSKTMNCMKTETHELYSPSPKSATIESSTLVEEVPPALPCSPEAESSRPSEIDEPVTPETEPDAPADVSAVSPDAGSSAESSLTMDSDEDEPLCTLSITALVTTTQKVMDASSTVFMQNTELETTMDDNIDEIEDYLMECPSGAMEILCTAAKIDAIKVTRYLFNQGYISLTNNDRETCSPLHVAAKHNSPKVTQFFISRRAKVNEKDKKGWSALQYAVQNNSTHTFEILIKAAADINVTNIREETLLHLAASTGHVYFIKRLVDEGLDKNAVDEIRNRPLHLASAFAKADAVEMLLELDASCTARNGNAHSPVDVICFNRRKCPDELKNEIERIFAHYHCE